MPLLEKSSSIIMMAESNDAIEKSSDEILHEILLLKNFIVDKLPEVEVHIACPTTRTDDQKARLTILRLRKKLSELKGDRPSLPRRFTP